VAKLYPQALDSVFIAFYDSQGYGGGIPTRLDAADSASIAAFVLPGEEWFAGLQRLVIEVVGGNSEQGIGSICSREEACILYRQ
jgi:hypothetical protein